MIGMLFLGGLLLYFLLWIPMALALRHFSQTDRKKRIVTWASLVVWILIPFGDHMAGLAYHSYICNTKEAGFNVYSDMRMKAEGLLNSSASASGAYSYLKQGYDYIEARASGALPSDHAPLSRYTLTPNGQLREERIDKPKSRFEVIERNHVNFKQNVYGDISLLVDRDSGETRARYNEYVFLGGWLVNYFVPRHSKHCPKHRIDYHNKFNKLLGQG